MKRTIYSEDIKPLSEFRANAAAMIEQVRSTRRPIVLTQHGKSSAVILDVLEYEALLERIEILQEIQQAQVQLDEGAGIEHNDAKSQVLSKLRAKK